MDKTQIYGEIKTRHCYASTAARVILYYTVNGEQMGSFLDTRSDHLDVLKKNNYRQSQCSKHESVSEEDITKSCEKQH